LKAKGLCAGFDARLFFFAFAQKRDGQRKHPLATSQISKPSRLRVPKSLMRFF
jgi:hypothetical protein